MEKDVHDLLSRVVTGGYVVVMRPTHGDARIIDHSDDLPAEMQDRLVAFCDEVPANEDQSIGDSTQASKIDLFHRLARVTGAEFHGSGSDLPMEPADLKAAVLVLAESAERDEGMTLGTKEVAYLKKVAEGMSDAEIAEDLGLSLRAVKERKRHVQRDLDASSIAHAVAIAHANQII